MKFAATLFYGWALLCMSIADYLATDPHSNKVQKFDSKLFEESALGELRRRFWPEPTSAAQIAPTLSRTDWRNRRK